MSTKDQDKSNEEPLTVFISYARPDVEIARKIESFLAAKGKSVFRDERDIHVGDNWDMTIERALRECERMVLLLSSSSMPYRKEVHREWFFFDQERKPIYPLFLEKCDLHSRLRAYNYIDATSDLPGALDRVLAELAREFTPPDPPSEADKITVLDKIETVKRKLPETLEELYKAVRDPKGGIVFSVDQAIAIRDHKPADLKGYRLGRIAEWSMPKYLINKRFVNLTLLLDKGEEDPQRWQRAEDFRFNDLRDVLDRTMDDPALVLLGAPGSGKSTLLRRLQLDHSLERLRDEQEQITFFVELSRYRPHAKGELAEPGEWLNSRWTSLYPQLPPLESFLQYGRVMLLLDAINEMPHSSTSEYHRLVGLWRDFTQDACLKGNRIVFSCRSLDYSASLSSKELRVPQVELQPMNAEQVRAFLAAYVPLHRDAVWTELEDEKLFEFYRTPYFLKLLCDQVETTGRIPKGRAGLFTGYIRQALAREINDESFQTDVQLTDRERTKLSQNKWGNPFELPDHGPLFTTLSELAYRMQEKGVETGGAQIRVDHEDACKMMAHERAEDLLKAGIRLNLLDEDMAREEIVFYHQLLQEYFAARKLARNPNPALVHVEWEAGKVAQSLEETVKGLAVGDPLPPLPQTGWEETTLTAAPMAADPETFVRDLMPHNLPLAARCVAAQEAKVSERLKREIQDGLIARTRDMRIDLRARISAGEALGLIGDPRFELREGPCGNYLMPPLVEIPGGTYPIGDDKSDYSFEKPAHKVHLETFKIGMFPVTNAEFKYFIDAGGYDDPRWWDTEESLKWLREGGSEGSKQGWRDWRKTLQSVTEEYIRNLVSQNRATPQQVDDWIETRNWTDEEFNTWLDETYPQGKLYRQPEYWDDVRFNNPSQPVVGVTWFEARAYCNWLTANAGAESGRIFRLPTEVEFEAAARGKKGRMFPYGKTFEVSRGNTFESHIRRSTPVGIFDNATPEGAFDLSGNVYTWTLSIYDQERFRYPYQSDEREDVDETGVRRVLRGGSWDDFHDYARAVYRDASRLRPVLS